MIPIFNEPGFKLRTVLNIHVHVQYMFNLFHCNLVPYSWDDVTLPEKLCVHVKTGSESRCFDMETVGSKGKVYYESYFYIVAMETRQSLSGAGSLTEPLVLDVPQGKAVLLNRKVIYYIVHCIHTLVYTCSVYT